MSARGKNNKLEIVIDLLAELAPPEHLILRGLLKQIQTLRLFPPDAGAGRQRDIPKEILEIHRLVRAGKTVRAATGQLGLSASGKKRTAKEREALRVRYGEQNGWVLDKVADFFSSPPVHITAAQRRLHKWHELEWMADQLAVTAPHLRPDSVVGKPLAELFSNIARAAARAAALLEENNG